MTFLAYHACYRSTPQLHTQHNYCNKIQNITLKHAHFVSQYSIDDKGCNELNLMTLNGLVPIDRFSSYRSYFKQHPYTRTVRS